MRERLDTVLAKKRLRELDAARQRDDMVRLEALRRSSQQAIYDYITTNQCDTVSYDAVKYLINKELLVDIAARYCGSPFWAEAKRQYWEVLDAEHRRRNIFQKLTTNALRAWPYQSRSEPQRFLNTSDGPLSSKHSEGKGSRMPAWLAGCHSYARVVVCRQ